jgi:hypothetical protein
MSAFHPKLPPLPRDRIRPIADATRFALPAPVKAAVFFIAVALLACSQRPPQTCPSIEGLLHRDPAADALAALAKGDHHLLTLGGFVGSTPGAEGMSATTNSMEIEGTSDTTTEACRRLGAVAEAYATKYNQTVVHGS